MLVKVGRRNYLAFIACLSEGNSIQTISPVVIASLGLGMDW